MPSDSREWRGTLLRQTLFVGSKSEGLYWVLLCNDGYWYRISEDLPAERLEWLNTNQGREVCLSAQLDLLRGHRRLVLAATQGAASISQTGFDKEGSK